MPCYSPIDAWQTVGGDIVFAERGNIARALCLPCGQCIGCRLERSRQWAVRCMHEAQMHEYNSFVTLTYDDDFLPLNGSLVYEDFQRFLKRTRRKLGKLRFYMCGEYGERNWRPHFHACLFGVFFEDRKYFRTLPSGSKIYTSEVLSELWPFGYASVGDVSFESSAYVARYICKKVTGQEADSHYKRVSLETGEVSQLKPEFCRMSLKPGIGYEWFRKYSDEVFPVDYVIVRGHPSSVPKFYKRLLNRSDPMASDFLDYDRYMRVGEFVDDYTPERLATREVVARARLGFKRRGLES